MLTSVSDLDLRLIRVFLAVVDARGITAAQSALNVGQSTLSAQLSTLEVRLGFRLCERGRGGFRLTAKGERFERYARELAATMDAFCQQARNIDKKLVGSLRIGLIDHTPPEQQAKLAEAIARFGRRDQNVQISIVQRAPGQIEQEMLNGSLDLAVGYFWHRVPSLEYRQIFTERQVACCGRAHPLFARKGRVPPAEALRHTWVGRSYPVAETQDQPLFGEIDAQADNMESVAIMLMSGRYLGYLPESFAAQYGKLKLLRVLNPAALQYEVPIVVVHRRRAERSDVLDAFLEDLTSGTAKA